ncbi:MAG: TIGR00341 family protein [Candidatus Pacebacteria bacterium]|nr:TIGR00341 family protein [Candidatus Paceibacterota bacterium]
MEIQVEIPKEKIKDGVEKFIDPFHIDNKRQEKVYDEIRENAKADFDFYVLTIFAGIIITLGLVVNSSAVVIGGMLLAPLVWPMLSLSVAIVKGRSRLMQSSVFTLIKSTAIIFVIALSLGFMSPDYALQGSEFLSRTSPTIFELFIALAAGFVGAFVITYPKIGAAIAGVVVAAALVPPIAVMGLSVAHGNLGMAGGAFVLYLSNLIAVTFSASILFLVSRFKGPSSEKGQEQRKSNIRWTLVLLFVMTIPLFLITSKVVKENSQQNIVRDVAKVIIPGLNITDVKINEENNISTVNITIQYSGDLTEKQINEFKDILSMKMDKIVVPRITVVPIVETWKRNE